MTIDFLFNAKQFPIAKPEHRDLMRTAQVAREYKYERGVKIGVDELQEIVALDYGDGRKLVRNRNASGEPIHVATSPDGRYWYMIEQDLWMPLD
ncbi:MAG TPA: hypothetical protein V6D17_05085 [Candidatus Obscuribacterales bacterium]